MSRKDLQKGVPKMMILWVIRSRRASIKSGDLLAAYGLLYFYGRSTNLFTPKCKCHQNIKIIYGNVRLDKNVKPISKLERGIHLFISAKQYRLSDLTNTVGF